VEAHRVLGVDEVDPPLRLAVMLPHSLQGFVRDTRLLRRLEIGDELDDRVLGPRHEGEVAVLDDRHPGLQLLLREAVAGLAGARDVEQRAAHMVVADLHRSLADVGHVAVGAGDAGAGVDPLAPQLELGVLRLQGRRPGPGVGPVGEAGTVGVGVIVVVALDLLDLQSVPPGKEEGGLGTAVVLDMALAADERAHFLPRGVAIGVVGGLAIPLPPGLDRREMGQGVVAGGQEGDPADQARLGDAQLHRLGVMAVDAGHRVRDELRGLVIRHLADRLEAGHELRLGRGAEEGILQRSRRTALQPRLAERDGVGGVAVETGARLLPLRHPLGGPLVFQHVGVAPAVPEVDRKGIPVEHRHQAWVPLQPARGQRLAPAAAVLGAARLGGAQVGIVLAREVLPPFCRIDHALIECRHLEYDLFGFFLAQRDILHQQQYCKRRRRDHDQNQHVHPQPGRLSLGHCSLSS